MPINLLLNVTLVYCHLARCRMPGGGWMRLEDLGSDHAVIMR